MKKKLLGAAGVLGAVLAILVVAAFVLVNPQKLVAEKKDAILAQVSAKIGRKVTAGDVTGSVGGSLTARVANLQVAGAEGKKPQLEVGALDIRFSLLKALLSFGRDLTVEHFTVTNLVARAARDDQGRWDFQDVLDRLAGPADDKKPDDGTSPLDGVRIASLQVKDARVELDDKLLGRPLAVSGLDVAVSDVEIGKPLAVQMKATLEDGAKKSPVDVDARLAVLPKGLSFDPVPDVSVKAKLDGVDLAPWGGLAPGDVPAPAGGTLDVQLSASAKQDLAVLAVDGTVKAKGLVLRDAVSAVAGAQERANAPKGAPLDADIALSLDVDQKKPHYALQKLTVKGSGLDVSGTAEASGTSLAALDKADVKASAADLGKLLAVLPPSLRGLPDAVKIDGPLEAKLTSNGNEIDAGVDLDKAHVRYLGEDGGALFDKAGGKALHLVLHGKRSATALDVDRFALALDTAKIGGTLSLPTAKDAPLAADVHSGPVELASLQDLVPPFADALKKGRKVAGTAQLDVKATSAGGKQQADAGLMLKGLDVNLDKTSAHGQAAITLRAEPGADGVHVLAGADFDDLAVQQTGDDGAAVVKKPAGLPLRLDVDAKKGKDRADVDKVLVAIGRSTVRGKGSITDLDKKEAKLDVDLGDVALAFDDLRAAVPGASKLPAGGRLMGRVKLAGGTSARTLVVDAKGLDVAFGRSHVAGDVHVKDLSDPVLDVTLPRVDLAFDDIRPLGKSLGDLPKGGRFAGSVTLAGDTARSSTVKAHVVVDSFSAAGSTMKGHIDVQNLDKPRFDLALDADELNVDKLRDAFGTDEPQKKSAKAAPAKDDNPHGLSKETRALLAETNGKGIITARHAVVKGIPLDRFKGQLTMTRGVARFDALDFGLYGGSVTAAGSLLDLPAVKTGYDLKLKGKDIDFGKAIAEQTRLGRIFSGKLSPDVSVKGRGLAAGDFAISAEGPAQLTFESLALSSLDLLSSIGDALKKTGKAAGVRPAAAAKGLSLQGFKAATQFAGGKLKLTKPVETDSALGKITWTGGAGLDAGLDLDANVALSPATVAKMTGNKVKPASAIPVPVKIGGTWDRPRVTGVDVKKLLEAILGAAAGNVVKGVEKGGANAAKDAAKDALDALGGKPAKKNDKNGTKKNDTAKKATDAAKKALGGLLGK